MNEAHLRICASPEWAAYVESEFLPWALQQADLGDEVLEVGPGPGLTTDVLRRQVPRLTAVESMNGWPARWPGGCPAATLTCTSTAPGCRSTPAGSARPPCSPCCITSRQKNCRTNCWPRCAGCSARAGWSVGSDGMAMPCRRTAPGRRLPAHRPGLRGRPAHRRRFHRPRSRDQRRPVPVPGRGACLTSSIRETPGPPPHRPGRVHRLGWPAPSRPRCAATVRRPARRWPPGSAPGPGSPRNTAADRRDRRVGGAEQRVRAPCSVVSIRRVSSGRTGRGTRRQMSEATTPGCST